VRTLHLGLRVADLARSLTFYTAIGYVVVGEVPSTGIGALTMLKLPDDEYVSLELVHDPEQGWVEPRGMHHFVVQVDDVHAMVARLAGQGVRAEAPSSPDGSDDFWTAWVTDPDGYRIELVQWLAGHRAGMTRSDFADAAQPMPIPAPRTPRQVVEELFRRQRAAGDPLLDDLVASDMVNHAAGPQGRAGLRAILRSIEVDLGPSVLEQHHLVVEGDLVAHHVTLHGTHRDSTMPLLADVPVTGRSARWAFFHLWRVEDGMLVEHWAARDDMGLLEQLRS
jgi:catechol 2,3-dioxygenase-like lactoylglutathione lyase family enzyme/predicted ester cyclase